jgi:hypothetical protein
MTKIKVFGDWKNQGASLVKVNNSWRTIGRSFVKINGVWKDATLGSPPPAPIMQWHTTGQFRISNYNSSFHYQARFVSGSGDALLDTSAGIYSLNGVNSGFFVSAAYALGAPRSSEGYMERKARTTVLVQVGENCYGVDCVPNRVALCNDPPGTDSDCCRNCPAPSYDGQNRCICWRFGQPDPLCYGGTRCDPIFGNVDDKKWANAPYFYTDRGSEWSKQS